jgi:hypothetical protein
MKCQRNRILCPPGGDHLNKNSSGFPDKLKKSIVGGLILIVLLIIFVVLFTRQKNPAQQAAQQAASLLFTETPGQETSTSQSSPTSTRVAITPTEIQTPTHAAPTSTQILPTSTPLPPTTTAVPALAIAAGGLQMRCLRNDYQLPITSPAVFSAADLSIQKSNPGESGFVITIPVRACGVFVTFNQPVADGIFVEVYEGSDTAPWYQKPLVKVEDQTNTAFAIVDHGYIADPPVWSLSYILKIRSKDQTYWQGGLHLNRTFPGLCWEGSIPDPILLTCPKIDRLEREPHPDMPTFVPGGLK